MTVFETARAFLWGRALAYRRIFLDHGTDTDIVLGDLARFCRARESTFNADPRLAAMLDGRREVWLRLSQHLNLTDDELWHRYGNPTLPQDKE